MAKTDPEAARRQRHKTIRWVVTVFLITVVISGIISLVSDEVMDSSSLPVAFLILLAIVMVGIIFDIIGMAVASADEKPFHSMAARKVPGSQEAIRLLRNAERVSSICNDVVGDICGVVSGSASAIIAVQVMQHFTFSAKQVIPLVMSAMVAVAQEFDPAFEETRIELRESKGGNYLSVTLTVTATSREQLDNLYRALTGHPLVKIVL